MSKGILQCPKCGYKIDDNANIHDESLKPKNGDISICLKCGAVHQFMDRDLVDVDYNSLPDDVKQEILKINNVRFKIMNV